jgi:hypothetical protein
MGDMLTYKSPMQPHVVAFYQKQCAIGKFEGEPNHGQLPNSVSRAANKGLMLSVESTRLGLDQRHPVTAAHGTRQGLHNRRPFFSCVIMR